MQFATHYYLLIDWVGEGEAGRRRGEGKGKGEGRGGRTGKCLAGGHDIRKLFIVYNFWVFVQFI